MKKYVYALVMIFFSIACFSTVLFGKTTTQKQNKDEFNPDPYVLLSNLLKNHEEIRTYRHRLESAEGQLRQSKGLYYPTLDLSGDAGRERVDKEFDNDTRKSRHEITLRANQLITDFGRTTNTIKRDEVLLQQAKAGLESISQQMIRDGITAYINIVRARERLKTARHSENRIKELTGIEKALVKKGAGLTSDVLQAKSQLAGAMALRVEAQGELNLAKNHFQAVFYHFPTPSEIDAFKEIDFPFAQLPDTLEAAIDTAIKSNPEIKITRYDLDMTRKEVKISKSSYFPTLSLFAEAINADDNGGTLGYRRDYSAGIQLNYNLYRGGSDDAAVKSAVANTTAAASHLEHAYKLIREQVRNSWEQSSTLKQRKEILYQQADILKNFLKLAKKERKMGTRSLLDVLNGEVNYINAQGTAISAREDTKIAAFNLLFSMGLIDLDLFSH